MTETSLYFVDRPGLALCHASGTEPPAGVEERHVFPNLPTLREHLGHLHRTGQVDTISYCGLWVQAAPYVITLPSIRPQTAVYAWTLASAVAPRGQTTPLWAQVARAAFEIAPWATPSESHVIGAACTFSYSILREPRQEPTLSGSTCVYVAPEGTFLAHRRGAVVLAGDALLPIIVRAQAAVDVLYPPERRNYEAWITEANTRSLVAEVHADENAAIARRWFAKAPKLREWIERQVERAK